MVNHPVSILRREPRARILRHAHSHHRSLSAVSSALANITPPASPDRSTDSEEHVEPPDVPDVASQIPGLFEESGCAVVAHRGLGMNLKPGKGIRENTVASIIAAHDFGADWSEFDVQVTKDGVPVLWHDDFISVRRGDGEVENSAIRDLTIEQLKKLVRPITETEEPVVIYRKFAGTPEPAPWIMDVEDEIPTLDELMSVAPDDLGFSLELKFGTPEDFPGGKKVDPARMIMELRATLAVCKSHPRRRVAFSTFDPDAATHMRALQGLYPVMFITNCQPGQDDVRRCSVEAGIKTALDADLVGLVIRADVLRNDPTVPTRVRAAGLMLGSYGGPNTDLALVERQVDLGVGYLCTDDVPAVARLMSARSTTRNAVLAGAR
ncbi:predicted protein [Micromonas commoda]|uniref:glycerophosphodiester phosphodiesterase n=1 Tax=Micromonas commoda (strain RCC299 / NOUM17 / CCMP2709) TaxID=296587 RepID=C1E368_MICCC|nr:predicted protein [Micromonas commoda]ACO62504.1 predicted protein [Micromonas commoda]|eukprot:XP_002501246.1 predicted protein [Micromonas commoda]